MRDRRGCGQEGWSCEDKGTIPAVPQGSGEAVLKALTKLLER
jgi:hypothetical protein